MSTVTPTRSKISVRDLNFYYGKFHALKNIHLEIPENLYAQVESRSGLAVKNGLTTLCGVIDSDYRGELKIVLINLGRDPVVVAKGSRIAQLVFHEVPSVSTEMVENIEDLSKTQRKDGGFGSTGVN